MTKSSPRRHHNALAACPIVLVRPRYPENLGAVARVMRTMGLESLVLVAPHPLADPNHAQACKMAVGANDLLEGARCVEELDEAVRDHHPIFATSARPRNPGVLSPREAARLALRETLGGNSPAWVFGGERNGLRRAELARCDHVVRIPMVANEPSLNLAQAVMVMLYELLVVSLEQERT